MNKNKQAEIIRKRNSRLNQQLEDLKIAFAYDKTLNREGYKHAKDLIEQLEKLKIEWEDALSKIREEQYEYQRLVDDLKKFNNMIRKTKKTRLTNKQKQT